VESPHPVPLARSLKAAAEKSSDRMFFRRVGKNRRARIIGGRKNTSGGFLGKLGNQDDFGFPQNDPAGNPPGKNLG
jgi:hypothetical protein